MNVLVKAFRLCNGEEDGNTKVLPKNEMTLVRCDARALICRKPPSDTLKPLYQVLS